MANKARPHCIVFPRSTVPACSTCNFRARQTAGTLVDQIVTAVANALEQRTYPAGTALPSVRGLARTHGLSPYTVAEAYHRLVSMGLIVSRAGAGYRVAERLAPGSYFRPGDNPSSWFRFNAATSDVPSLWRFLSGLRG
jgi:DNA-binding transcriptional MocR family regulator